VARDRSLADMIVSVAVRTLVAGLVFGLSLIVAIGAQNTYVLRQGLLRDHVLTVVAICALSDVTLIAAGVAGAGVALDGRHWLLSTVRVIGATFLFGFAALAARRAFRPVASRPDSSTVGTSRIAVVGACLAFTWLNPAVYLDTVVLLGSVANTRPGHQWWFGGGAALGSLLWFTGLGFGARLLAPVFQRPRAWQVLDIFVAVVMVATGLRVLLDG
jgi:L-lysine exporter family protein LysE/ArgO